MEKESANPEMVTRIITKMREWGRINLPIIATMLNLDPEKEKGKERQKDKKFVLDEIYNYIEENQGFYVEDLLKHLEEKGCPQTEEAIRQFLDYQVREKWMIKPSEDFYRVK